VENRVGKKLQSRKGFSGKREAGKIGRCPKRTGIWNSTLGVRWKHVYVLESMKYIAQLLISKLLGIDHLTVES